MPNTKENIARFRQRRRENYQMMRQAGLDAKTAQALKNRKRETIEDLCKLLRDDDPVAERMTQQYLKILGVR
jgi:hypothetical protein